MSWKRRLKSRWRGCGMSEWRKVKLGDLIKIKHGFAFKSKFYVEKSLYSLVTLKNISESSEFVFDSKSATYYGGEFSEEYILKSGDLIIPLTEQVIGLLGNSAFVPKNANVIFVLNQRVGKVESIRNDVDVNFLKYLLSTTNVRKQMEYRASGTKQRNISPKDIYDITVYIPEYDNQICIGNLLRTIDNQIALNNQINTQLEAMAKTLYDYWFVQFDFPDENGKPYKSSGGKMVYNETLKREIPEGWEVKKLGEMESRIITGKTPSRKKEENFGGKIPFVTIGDIRGNTFVWSSADTLSDKGADGQKTKYLPADSLCVSCIATVGEIGFTTQPSQTNQQINSIIFQCIENKYYIPVVLVDFKIQ